ncbi:hypothetical protein B0H13DRAFT_2283296 [Mycena leptocephala]|nr:hypothetical protein B0H13DRAFT_2283296 [Mycena leptocephala]
MTAISFYLHGKSAHTDGITIDVQKGDDLKQLRKTVAERFSVALPANISFHVSADADAIPSELKALDTTDAILEERSVAILIGGKKVRPVPGPTGGIPFIGGYSEIYPDFMGNYQRLLRKYGHIVHVAPRQGLVSYRRSGLRESALSEGNFFKQAKPSALPFEDDPPERHKFMMSAMGAKAMRNYVRIMDHTAGRLVKCFDDTDSSLADPFRLIEKLPNGTNSIPSGSHLSCTTKSREESPEGR